MVRCPKGNLVALHDASGRTACRLARWAAPEQACEAICAKEAQRQPHWDRPTEDSGHRAPGSTPTHTCRGRALHHDVQFAALDTIEQAIDTAWQGGKAARG